MKRIKSFNENAQDMMNLPTNINKKENNKKSIANQVNNFERINHGTPCSDYLNKSIDKTFEDGGNGQNLDENLSTLAEYLDDYHKDSHRDSVEQERGFYTNNVIDKFKMLVDSMSDDEILYNNEKDI